jgi:hypothetical protein
MATRQWKIRLRRAYEPPGPEDGVRILIDRLWPRGIGKSGGRHRSLAEGRGSEQRAAPLVRARSEQEPSGTPPVFWFVGGTDPDAYAKAKAAGRLNEIPTNHSPRFAPVIHPTLQSGAEALAIAALAWLSA